jgi:hypothetical protein
VRADLVLPLLHEAGQEHPEEPGLALTDVVAPQLKDDIAEQLRSEKVLKYISKYLFKRHETKRPPRG